MFEEKVVPTETSKKNPKQNSRDSKLALNSLSIGEFNSNEIFYDKNSNPFEVAEEPITHQEN